MTIIDRQALRPVFTGVTIATVLHRLYPNDFDVDKMQRLLRDPRTLEAIRNGVTISWAEDEAEFAKRRAKYLLY